MECDRCMKKWGISTTYHGTVATCKNCREYDTSMTNRKKWCFLIAWFLYMVIFMVIEIKNKYDGKR
jgi:hypothetical protein